MNIYLPLEVQQRELDARVYLAANLAALGHTAYFGHKSNLFTQIKKLKPGVFIHKSIQIRKIKQILLLKDLGHVNLAFDESMIPTSRHISIGELLENVSAQLINSLHGASTITTYSSSSILI